MKLHNILSLANKKSIWLHYIFLMFLIFLAALIVQEIFRQRFFGFSERTLLVMIHFTLNRNKNQCSDISPDPVMILSATFFYRFAQFIYRQTQYFGLQHMVNLSIYFFFNKTENSITLIFFFKHLINCLSLWRFSEYNPSGTLKIKYLTLRLFFCFSRDFMNKIFQQFASD